MKTLSIFLPFLVAFTFCPTLGRAQQVQQICLFNFAWQICIVPSGGAYAQFGSIPEDCLYLKAGTIDFWGLIETINNAERAITPQSGQYQITVHRPGHQMLYSFALKEDAFIERILSKIDKEWIPCSPGSRTRIEEIRHENPIVPKN